MKLKNKNLRAGAVALLVAQLVQRYLSGSARLPLGRTRGPAQRRGVKSLGLNP